jgi:hypothetical protein
MELEAMNMIVRSGSKIGFNKDYESWKKLNGQVTKIRSLKNSKLPSQVTKVTSSGNKKLPDQVTTPIKENKRKKKYSCNSTELQLSELLLNLIMKRRETFKRPNLQKWAQHINLMIRKDKRSYEEIESVIRWSQENQFWRNNILSTRKLREKFDRLALQMTDDKNQQAPVPPYYDFYEDIE